MTDRNVYGRFDSGGARPPVCDAVIKHARGQLTAAPKTVEQIYDGIRWWTPDTVREAVEFLARTGEAAVAAGNEGRRYCIRGIE